jgi:hypothetical protein
VLLLREGERPQPPVVVVDDGSAAAQRARDLALALAPDAPPQVVPLAQVQAPERLAALVRRLGAGLLVLPVAPPSPLADPALLESLPCPLLLVR